MVYLLKAGANKSRSNSALVDYVSRRFTHKQNVWYQRWVKLEEIRKKLRFFLSVYNETGGDAPLGSKNTNLYYRSMQCHQAANILMGTKFSPDFVDFAPLLSDYDQELYDMTDALTRAIKVNRYQGLHDLAKDQSKKDLIFGNSFIEMALEWEGDDPLPKGVQYQCAPFQEMRNNYGDPDKMRVMNYSVESYAEEYGEDELDDVAIGGIVEATRESGGNIEKNILPPEGQIQVVRFYNPARKIFAEIHGGNGKIYKNLEGENYPLIGSDGRGFDPFEESRFYEDPTSDFFGYGVFDFLVDFANLDTTITNAVAVDAVWSASAPTFIEASDPDKMRSQLRQWEKNRTRGRNRVMVEKASGLGQKATVTDLSRPVRTDILQTFDDVNTTRTIRASHIDVNAMTDYAPTAEQQKLKRIEADKLNLRVLQLNEQRNIQFARNEMYFIKNTKTDFHEEEIEVNDQFADKYRSPDGFKPMKKMKIGEILDETHGLHLKVSPRMEGALDDQTFLEIQEMQQDLGLIPNGTQAKVIALEKYISKKNPDWGLKREDFMAPQQVTSGAPQGPGFEREENAVTSALTQQLATA